MPEMVSFHQALGRDSEQHPPHGPFTLQDGGSGGPQPPTGHLLISADPSGVWDFVLIVGYSPS